MDLDPDPKHCPYRSFLKGLGSLVAEICIREFLIDYGQCRGAEQILFEFASGFLDFSDSHSYSASLESKSGSDFIRILTDQP